MHLGNLLKTIPKEYKTIDIRGISYDSRKVKKKYIFFAIKGTKTSGTEFIDDAITKGASAIVSSKELKYKNSRVPFVLVKDVRQSLTEAISKFYKKKPKNIIAVTGTNGKSSIADFFYQILTINKVPVASIGTLGLFYKDHKKKTNLTSLDPISLHQSLQMLAKKKINNVILEASSHGLDQKRLDYLNIKTGIFTNFSHDHLDYHKSIKSYLNSKMYLFKNLLNKNSNIITDEDNKEFKIINEIAKRKKINQLTIGTNTGNIKILENIYFENKQIVKVLINSKIFSLDIPLIGYFQVKNLLMAILAATKSGIRQEKIFKQIKQIKPVAGRLECVAKLKNNSKIIIDFAHTPDGLKQSLIALKKQFNNKILIVFGCGGERDKSKRFQMGKIAKKYCRKVFVTDDNPRNENPAKIRYAIIKACKKLAINVGSRRLAIEKGINELNPNEILLIAGKGHETTQDYGKTIIKFSDQKVVKKILSKVKLRIKKNYWPNFIAKKVFKTNNLNYNGASINTKTIKKNNLFFAIRGKNVDGHKFIKEALKKGAIKAVIDKKVFGIPENKTIKVKNTFSSLNDLARVTRANTLAQIIGVTGSAGKTTLKNLISFGLENYGDVYHSPHSYNNKFGVPLSLSNLKQNTKYGIFEIGMDKKGEIDFLSNIVKPKIAIITNISEAHIENFRSLREIAKAKSEIIDNIQKDGYIVLNKDDKFFNFLSNKAKQNGVRVVSFSAKKKADIFLLKITKVRKYYKLKISIKKKIFHFYTTYSTSSFINNVLACVSTYSILGLDLNIIKRKFTYFSIPNGRGDISIIKKFKKKFKFIDESYNANPLSRNLAIQNMHKYKKQGSIKKLVLLGDMLELGKKSKKLHKDLASAINKSDIDKVFVYGTHIKETFNSLYKNKKGKIFDNLHEAYDYFRKIIHNNDLLMVKGSNATGLNKFSKNIKKGRSGAI